LIYIICIKLAIFKLFHY